MKMRMARIILFTGQIEAMSRFYAEVLGLRQVTDEKGWKEFAAGGVRIALHSGLAWPQMSEDRLPCGRCPSHTGNTSGAWRTLRQGPPVGVLPLRRQGPGRQSPSIVQPLGVRPLAHF